MRRLMGVIKDRHGTYYAQQRVPPRLQEAVALVLNSGKAKQVFLKRSLGTKDLKAANVAAKPVLAEFDRTLADAEALLKERPVIASITDAQIKRMSESYHAAMLANDEEERREGTGSEEVFQSVARQLSAAGIDYRTPFTVGELPEAGLSDREIYERKDTLEYQLAVVPPALARGDITVIKEELDELLSAFQLNVDRKSPSYRKLGMAVLAAHVRALRDIERRNSGEPVETPQHAYTVVDAPAGERGGTLREALEGWKKERERPEDTANLLDQNTSTPTANYFIKRFGSLAKARVSANLPDQTRSQITTSAWKRKKEGRVLRLQPRERPKQWYRSEDVLLGLKRLAERKGGVSARLIDEDARFALMGDCGEPIRFALRRIPIGRSDPFERKTSWSIWLPTAKNVMTNPPLL
jgi:hypothetical protein